MCRILIRLFPYDQSPVAILQGAVSSGPILLLESARHHPVTGRYSLLATDPFLVFRSWGHRVELRWRDHTEVIQAHPFDVLRRLFREYTLHPPLSTLHPPLPFYCGAIGYFSYEARHLMERGTHRARHVWESPEIQLAFVDTAIVWDHVAHQAWLLGYVHPEESMAKAQERFERLESKVELASQFLVSQSPLEGSHCEPAPFPLATLGVRAGSGRRSNLRTRLLRPGACPEGNRRGARNDREVRSRDGAPTFVGELSQEAFEDMVWRAKEYIRQGEIYQANLSMRFGCEWTGIDPIQLYLMLREVNPSPFAGFLRFEDVTVVSCSPERLIRRQGRLVETRPIAGTRPRSPDQDEDRQLSAELFLSEKERAEHLMLVDLERNDLGRVCEFGSVRVNEFMVEERYSHVRHIVSNIQGTLQGACDQFDLLRAIFPGGTITGVPKIRCMEIIDELEPVTRGIYTGSFGYLSFHGDLDLNIAIRTMVITGHQCWVQAGAGIVADSHPTREYEEVLHKAQALFEAITLANRHSPSLLRSSPALLRSFGEAEKRSHIANRTANHGSCIA